MHTVRNLAYGGGSIKRMGLYDEVMRLLDGCEVHELPGIAPNPRVGPEHFDEMAEHAVEAEGLAYAWVPLEPADVKAIYEMCL